MNLIFSLSEKKAPFISLCAVTLIKPTLLNTGARQEEGKSCEAFAQTEGSVLSGKVPQEGFHGSLHPLSLSKHSQEQPELAPGTGMGMGEGAGRERQMEESRNSRLPLSWRCEEQESAPPGEDNSIPCGRAQRGSPQRQQLVLGAANLRPT